MAPKKLLTVSSTPAVNLSDRLNSLAQMLSKKQAADAETFVVTTKVQDIKDVDDEFTREEIFARQAKLAVDEVFPRLKELGIPTEVPENFKRGDKMKDDKHMAKIRDTLRAKKDTIEKSQRMRKLRELKKMGKKIQTEVLRKRAKEKKDFLEKVKKRPVSELFDDK